MFKMHIIYIIYSVAAPPYPILCFEQLSNIHTKTVFIVEAAFLILRV